MKSVMISIQSKWCELIASGKKIIEVRKTRPTCNLPFKCYIYATKNGGGSGKVIGEFVCDRVYVIEYPYINAIFSSIYGYFNIEPYLLNKMCLDHSDLETYGDGKTLYGWHISNLKIYDKPKELSDFKKYNRTCYYDHLGLATPKCKDCKECNFTHPPQSWCYVELL